MNAEKLMDPNYDEAVKKPQQNGTHTTGGSHNEVVRKRNQTTHENEFITIILIFSRMACFRCLFLTCIKNERTRASSVLSRSVESHMIETRQNNPRPSTPTLKDEFSTPYFPPPRERESPKGHTREREREPPRESNGEHPREMPRERQETERPQDLTVSELGSTPPRRTETTVQTTHTTVAR